MKRKSLFFNNGDSYITPEGYVYHRDQNGDFSYDNTTRADPERYRQMAADQQKGAQVSREGRGGQAPEIANLANLNPVGQQIDLAMAIAGITDPDGALVEQLTTQFKGDMQNRGREIQAEIVRLQDEQRQLAEADNRGKILDHMIEDAANQATYKAMQKHHPKLVTDLEEAAQTRRDAQAAVDKLPKWAQFVKRGALENAQAREQELIKQVRQTAKTDPKIQEAREAARNKMQQLQEQQKRLMAIKAEIQVKAQALETTRSNERNAERAALDAYQAGGVRQVAAQFDRQANSADYGKQIEAAKNRAFEQQQANERRGLERQRAAERNLEAALSVSTSLRDPMWRLDAQLKAQETYFQEQATAAKEMGRQGKAQEWETKLQESQESRKAWERGDYGSPGQESAMRQARAEAGMLPTHRAILRENDQHHERQDAHGDTRKERDEEAVDVAQERQQLHEAENDYDL